MKQFTGGMNKDMSPAKQPEGTYRDALNANISDTMGSVVNESGVFKFTSVDNFEVIGKVLIDDDSIVLFGRQRVDATATSSFYNTISIFYPKQDRTVILYSHPDLNFKSTHPVVGTYRKNQAGEVLVYFTDGYYKEEPTGLESSPTYISENNPPRVINITRQYNWVLEPGNYNILYGDATKTPKNLELSPRIGEQAYFGDADYFGEPVKIGEGGSLECGAYYLALAYSDDDGVETNYFAVSNPVYIAVGNETALPTTSMTGGGAGVITNKSISWRVVVPGKAIYNYIQPAIIKVVENTTTAFKLTRVSAPAGDTTNINYTGLEDASSISVEDITIDDISYLTAQSIEQVNNRLYLGNLKTSKDVGYQPFANQIELEAVTETVSQFNPRVYDITILNQGYSQMIMPWNRELGQTFKRDLYTGGSTISVLDLNNTNINKQPVINGYATILQEFMAAPGGADTKRGYKSSKYSYKKKGYRRGEVYSFYISFVLKDGTETYAYHIPGRSAFTLGFSIKENQNIKGNQDYVRHREGYGLFSRELHEYNEGLKVFQIADTGDHCRNPNGDGTYTPKTTGYWENSNEFYPDTPEFNEQVSIDSVTGEVIEDATVEVLAGSPVRHHKMPSNQSSLVPGYVTNNDVKLNYVQEHASKYTGSANILQTNNNLNNEDTLVTLEAVNILGIKLKNVKIPKYLLYNIQGYKVYYAKRGEDDKLIQGQSIAIPAHPRYASNPSQSVVQAKKGPYYKGWYLYGGLVSDGRDGMYIFPTWRYRTTNNAGEGDEERNIYIGNPAFTFHDFTMLRKKSDLRRVSHVQCQYGVVFRPFLGGPGNFVPFCDYDKIRNAPIGNSGYNLNDTPIEDQESTTLPSAGWVSAEMGNTISYTFSEGQSNTAKIVDISDKVTDPTFEPGADARLIGIENDDDVNDQDTGEKREAKKKRVRAFFTGVFIGTAYVNPYEVVTTEHFIKGGDNKWGTNAGNWFINRFHKAEDYGETAFNATGHTNQFNFVVSSGSASYLTGNSTTKVQDASAFSGAQLIYNGGGESTMLIGLESGLPALRGHLPNLNPSASGSFQFGFTRWGESYQYLFPDAADYSHPYGGITLAYEKAGSNGSAGPHEYNQFRGGSYFLEAKNSVYMGYPMAWLVNLCSIRTDVYNPFDKQQLVWTGYFKRIDIQELVSEGGDETTYYNGVTSDKIFGGDTYICKYNFRTTSQSYGHTHFRSNIFDRRLASDPDIAAYGDLFYTGTAAVARRDQADIPSNLNVLSGNMGTTIEDVIWKMDTNFYGGVENIATATDEGKIDARTRAAQAALMENENWVQGTPDPVSSLFTFMVESQDNLELRHKDSSNYATSYFDVDPARGILFAPPTNDFTKSENLLYSEHYSALQDKKCAIPLPKGTRLTDIDNFETRVARSNVDTGSLADGYRKFKALEYKDIDSNRGEIKSIFSLNGTLYLHTKRGIFLTKGKEELQLSAVTAFIGSGNIFSQPADELNQTSTGFGGTDSRHAYVTTEFGHFFVNRRDRAIYSLAGNQIENIGNAGMSSWLRDNMEFELASYGINLDGDEWKNQGFYTDATTSFYGLGYTLGYDPVDKRILITKREPIPTQAFIDAFNAGEILIVDNIPTLVPGPAGDACTEYIVDSGDGAQTGDTRGTAAFKEKPLAEGTIYCGPISLQNPTYFTEGGWTLSYYPELRVWGSRHSYLPNLYMNTSDTFISVAKGETPSTAGSVYTSLWKHGNESIPGGFYGSVYPFEIEFIDNTAPSEAKLFSSLYYWVDSFKKNTSITGEFDRRTSPGFTKFYAYTSTQITGLPKEIQYLTNARLVDRLWYINDIRDNTKLEEIISGELITGAANVSGQFTNSVYSNIQNQPMFLEEGKVNPEYIDNSKAWHNKKKLVDHFIGIRLINDNSEGNLVHLHGAGTKFRKSYR